MHRNSQINLFVPLTLFQASISSYDRCHGQAKKGWFGITRPKEKETNNDSQKTWYNFNSLCLYV